MDSGTRPAELTATVAFRKTRCRAQQLPFDRHGHPVADKSERPGAWAGLVYVAGVGSGVCRLQTPSVQFKPLAISKTKAFAALVARAALALVNQRDGGSIWCVPMPMQAADVGFWALQSLGCIPRVGPKPSPLPSLPVFVLAGCGRLRTLRLHPGSFHGRQHQQRDLPSAPGTATSAPALPRSTTKFSSLSARGAVSQ